MSYLTQMAGLSYHNFASAATGIAIAIAFMRGIVRKDQTKLKSKLRQIRARLLLTG